MISRQFTIGSKNALSGLSFSKQKGERVFQWQKDIYVVVTVALSSTKLCLTFLKFSSWAEIFGKNSTGSASSSKAKQVGIPYTEILKRGSWKGANTFTKHYDKHIINKGDLVDFDFVTPIVSKFKDD